MNRWWVDAVYNERMQCYDVMVNRTPSAPGPEPLFTYRVMVPQEEYLDFIVAMGDWVKGRIEVCDSDG